jgi:hypothetical protein
MIQRPGSASGRSWTVAAQRVKVRTVGTMQLKGAGLQTIARWAADGEGFVPVVLHDIPTSYTVGWEDGDILAIQGDAHIHIDSHGSVKDDDLAVAHRADV